MKNILITSTTRENQGTAYSFVKDINDIQDINIRTMVINCIRGIEWESTDHNYWTVHGMCGSERGGYIFNDYALFTKMLPLTIDHIIDYVF